MALPRFRPGAPGVYELPSEPVRALTGERMDVCAFLGVAPRGPAHVPSFRVEWAPKLPRGLAVQRTVAEPVESFDEYLDGFGGFEGPGLLPYAVASFFENGGVRAWVARIVHAVPPGTEVPGIARATLTGLTREGGGEVWLRARNEGAWGDALSATLKYARRTLELFGMGTSPAELIVAADAELQRGALLLVRLSDGTRTLRFVSELRDDWEPATRRSQRKALLEFALPSAAVFAEVVEGELVIREKGAPARTETHTQLAFTSGHPRFVGRVLVEASRLVYPDERATFDWTASDLRIDPALAPAEATDFDGGVDRCSAIVPEDFFGDWTPGDEEPSDGVHALFGNSEVALVCAPDLYSPKPLVAPDLVVSGPIAGAEFAPCVDLPPPPVPVRPPDELLGLRLDPKIDLDVIATLQGLLVEFADQTRAFTVLLDVPPGLDAFRIERWRARFGSAFAAAYHPWLRVSRPEDERTALIDVPPSAVAAGIVAARELIDGVMHGPANVISRGVVDVTERISPARHDALHPRGINVFLRERDGARLTAARTLSREPEWRQLSVRRLVSMVERALHLQMQWAVFEPNSHLLRGEVVSVLTRYLRQLHRANAFTGASESEGFFVRCDDALNPPRVQDRGELIVEVGVAPTEPLEFIVLTITRNGDGTLRVGA